MTDTTQSSRTMPHNLDAERAILSAILRDNQVLVHVGDALTPDDFYLESHQAIYRALHALSDEGAPLDAISLAEALSSQALLERVGGVAYVGDLVDYIGTTVGVKHYVQIVRDKAQLRRMIRAATEIATDGYAEGVEIHAYLDQAERRIFEVLGQELRGAGAHIREVLRDAIVKIEQLAASAQGVTGTTTGYRDLDDILLGLQDSDLIIVAARPAMGKTTLAMNIAANAALQGNAAVVVFSLEMSREQLGVRLLSSEARVDLKSLRSGHLSDADWPKVHRAAGALAKTAFHIDDTPALSLMELRAKARRLKLQNQCDLIVVDYLQLMRSGKDLQSREQEISEISRGLKSLAKELNVPVIALSQLNRGLEQRGDKRPMLSDLRESGAIEQDADVIVFIYRDEVYNKETQDEKVAEIIVGKQRNGPTGTARLYFNGAITRFDNLARDPGSGAH